MNAMVQWPHDLGLEFRMVVTLFLLMVIYFVFIAVLAYIGVETLFLVAYRRHRSPPPVFFLGPHGPPVYGCP